jgi:hypothetical protein
VQQLQAFGAHLQRETATEITCFGCQSSSRNRIQILRQLESAMRRVLWPFDNREWIGIIAPSESLARRGT